LLVFPAIRLQGSRCGTTFEGVFVIVTDFGTGGQQTHTHSIIPTSVHTRTIADLFLVCASVASYDTLQTVEQFAVIAQIVSLGALTEICFSRAGLGTIINVIAHRTVGLGNTVHKIVGCRRGGAQARMLLGVAAASAARRRIPEARGGARNTGRSLQNTSRTLFYFVFRWARERAHVRRKASARRRPLQSVASVKDTVARVRSEALRRGAVAFVRVICTETERCPVVHHRAAFAALARNLLLQIRTVVILPQASLASVRAVDGAHVPLLSSALNWVVVVVPVAVWKRGEC
jgi:hypothetical protein